MLGEGGVLPLCASSSVAVLGALAELPRYQVRVLWEVRVRTTRREYSGRLGLGLPGETTLGG